MMNVKGVCPFCNKPWSIYVDKAGYKKWKDGELIQNVMPELKAEHRELLISGVCPKCWKELE